MTLYDESRREFPIAAESSEFRGIIEAEVRRALEWMRVRDALSERHQRLVEAAKEFLRVICSNTIQNNESLKAINALKAVLEGEKGAQETSCQATHE